MAQNAIICAINRFDSGTYTEGPEDTLYLDFVNGVYGLASASSTSLPVSNLANRQLSKVWRTANTNPLWTWFTCNFGSVRQIDVVSLLAHNISALGKWRVRLSNDPTFATSIYDSGLVASQPDMASFGVKPWGVWQWGEALGAYEVPTDLKINSVLVLPASYNAMYLRIDISDPTNADGYIEAGRCYAGPKYQPTKNISYGWEIGWQDDSEAERSLGGQLYFNPKPKYREVKFTLEYVTQEEAYLNLFEFIDRRKGVSGDILFIPQPDRTDFYLYEVIYGRMRELGSISQPTWNTVSKSYVLEELI